MARPKIVLIGGGSATWTPGIVRDMLMTEPLQEAEYVLYDIDRQAAGLLARVLEPIRQALGVRATIRVGRDRAEAFGGAGYFVLTISTGGLEAMGRDLAIPEDFGIFHTVGDTSGPGGWARTLRNFAPVAELGQAINRNAPGALVLNYTNPMTTLTQILSRICQGPVIGLCHGLFENLEFIKRLYGLRSEDEISVRYAGLNHFFWITEARARGKDLLADLDRRLRRGGFTALRREAGIDPLGFRSHRELATELWRLTGVMPYLGDRHTCEFFPGYITNKSAMRRLRLIRTSIAERAQILRKRRKELRRRAGREVPKGSLRKSRESAAAIIAAHWTGRPFVDVGNLPNLGQVANLPLGTVVETAVRVDANGFAPLAFGNLPAVVQGLLEPWARVFNLTVEACFAGDPELALQALRLDPVCSHLDNREVRALGLRLLRAHRRFLPGELRGAPSDSR